MSQANETQVGGDHYKSQFQHWDWVLELQLPYLPAQVTKYITRWRKKNGIQDLDKASHFLDKFIENEESRRHKAYSTTQRYFRDNDISMDERMVITNIVNHHIESVKFLQNAATILRELIRRQAVSSGK